MRVQNFLLERGDKTEKGGSEVDVEMRGVASVLLLYSSITFTVWGKVRFPL